MSMEFWVTSLVVTATPGTGALFTITAGLAHGTRVSLVAALGCTLGIVPHLALALTGAAALLAASPVAFAAVTWLGVGYLLYLAWTGWRSAGTPPATVAEPPPAAGRVIAGAVLVNLLNPKLTLFFLVFLPLFVDPEQDGAVARMSLLGLAFMALTLATFAAYGVAAAWLRQRVIGRPRVMRRLERGFAATFVALAAMLALSHP